MGSALIDLGQATATRVIGNMGYNLRYTAFPATVFFGASGTSRNFWSQTGFPANSVRSVNAILLFNVHPGISNLTVTCGNGSSAKNYGWVQRPITVTAIETVTINLNTIISLSGIFGFFVNGIANFTGTTPRLIASGSSVSITRIG